MQKQIGNIVSTESQALGTNSFMRALLHEFRSVAENLARNLARSVARHLARNVSGELATLGASVGLRRVFGMMILVAVTTFSRHGLTAPAVASSTASSAASSAVARPKRDMKVDAAGTENAASLKDAAAPGGKALDLPHAPKQPSAQDMKTFRALDATYQKAESVKMDVNKTLKLGLLQQERRAKGTLLISSGRLRLELTGEEKTLLVVNKTNYWAVTYPSAEFKDAPVQVIEGATTSATKKSQQSQSILGLLTRGGFLKFFNVAGVQKEKTGELTYFLQPQKSASEFKRAELKVSADGKEIRELHYWDERDNETLLAFKDVVFGKKPTDSSFTFDTPAGADVMKM